MSYLTTIRSAALRSLIPPPRLQLSEWIETNIKLPEGVSALPGAIRLYPYQREIADAISDPEIERVTMVKAARLDFTTLLIVHHFCGVLCPLLAHCRPSPPSGFGALRTTGNLIIYLIPDFLIFIKADAADVYFPLF